MRQDARRIGRKTEGSRSTSTTCNVTGGRGRRPARRDERRTQRYPKGDRLKQLRAFCRSARLGSISRAAERLRLSQPSVSLQVSALEEELGLSLFDRRGRSLLLTHVGERLYHLALPLVHGMDRFPDTFAEQHHGVFADSLRIGAGDLSGAHLLPPFLQCFRRQFPGARVEVRIGSGRERLRWLREFEIDLAITAMDSPRSGFSLHPILVSRTMLITPVDHPLVGRTSVTVADVVPYPVVGHASMHLVGQTIEALLRVEGIDLDIVAEVDGWDIIKKYVAAGIGVAFVPELCLTAHDRLWRIPVGGGVPQRAYGVITRRDGLTSLAASRFLDIMVPDGARMRGTP